MRLCDDQGMVSNLAIDEPNRETCDKTYLGRMVRLRALTATITGNKLEDVSDQPAWPCTGHAHLAGEHIRCTSPAHHIPHPPPLPLHPEAPVIIHCTAEGGEATGTTTVLAGSLSTRTQELLAMTAACEPVTPA